jgi:hypothetical protein
MSIFHVVAGRFCTGRKPEDRVVLDISELRPVLGLGREYRWRLPNDGGVAERSFPLAARADVAGASSAASS